MVPNELPELHMWGCVCCVAHMPVGILRPEQDLTFLEKGIMFGGCTHVARPACVYA